MNKRHLWPYVARLPKPLKTIIQYLCGIFTGHSFDGDWGYGGGDYADAWCRHCDKMEQIRKESIWFKDRNAKELMNEVKNDRP